LVRIGEPGVSVIAVSCDFRAKNNTKVMGFARKIFVLGFSRLDAEITREKYKV